MKVCSHTIRLLLLEEKSKNKEPTLKEKTFRIFLREKFRIAKLTKEKKTRSLPFIFAFSFSFN